MSDETFLSWAADIQWAMLWLRWPVAITAGLLALVLTEGW